MEFLFDTANIEDIKKCGECYPYTGITSNPGIIKAAGKIDFFPHFREIRTIIGFDRTLHIQTVAADCKGILREANTILSNVDEKVYIKIPVTDEGLMAIQALKKRGVSVTATAIYSKIQGFMAISAGADYIAMYYNRMENMDINAADTVSAFAEMISRGFSTKILGASFKNISQVNNALVFGAHAVTVQPALLRDALNLPVVQKAVEDFAGDWKSVFGKDGIS
jgi:TalC/MipB family fructose-6-phosphate aldolase